MGCERMGLGWCGKSGWAGCGVAHKGEGFVSKWGRLGLCEGTEERSVLSECGLSKVEGRVGVRCQEVGGVGGKECFHGVSGENSVGVGCRRWRSGVGEVG